MNEHKSRLKSFQLHQILCTENTKADCLAWINTDWRKLLLEYFHEGTLPAYKNEAARFKSRANRLTLQGGIIYKPNSSQPYL
ncbi:UNVERIFIED_CONTAM: hypothetical protein Slati_2249000 [Sesamum latifolium]|uniref:Uncharacterized protein n=1 Tax=Sesamum latifolium TaxID=2727402 RepID=A0AAW2WV16_9LAMI